LTLGFRPSIKLSLEQKLILQQTQKTITNYFTPLQEAGTTVEAAKNEKIETTENKIEDKFMAVWGTKYETAHQGRHTFALTPDIKMRKKLNLEINCYTTQALTGHSVSKSSVLLRRNL